MLISKSIEVKWHYKNREHYESQGYKFTGYKDMFHVKIEDVPSWASASVEVMCDYCLNDGIKKIIKKSYSDYVSSRVNLPKDACKGCSFKKQEEYNMLTFGAKYPMQNKEYQEKLSESQIRKYGKLYSQTDEYINKVKSTNLNKFGSENVMHNEEIKKKVKNTNLAKYGTEYASQNKDVKNKQKETIKNRYGVDHYSKTEEYKKKIKNTSLENFGVDHPFQSDLVKEKIKKTTVEKHGVEYYSQTDEFKTKFKESSLNKFGVVHPLKNKEILEKVKNTNIVRYGHSNPMQNPEISAKAKQTLYQNGTCPTSSQQIAIYEMLKENHYNVELNYPVSNVNLDVAIFIDKFKIDLEYDGSYWHQDDQKDRKRDEFIKSEGWKVLRIESRRKIPSFQEIKMSIDKLLYTDRTFTRILLDDVIKESVG